MRRPEARWVWISQGAGGACYTVGDQKSGRGAAWLARLLGVQEVPGSNPGGPTKFLKELRVISRDRPWLYDHDFWTPSGLQECLHDRVDSTRAPAVAFGGLLAFHMPRARSHGIFRFSVARRTGLAYSYEDFRRHGVRGADSTWKCGTARQVVSRIAMYCGAKGTETSAVRHPCTVNPSA